MCASVAHEQLAGFYSYSVFNSVRHGPVPSEYEYSSSKNGVLMFLKNKMAIFLKTGSNDFD
jgi:hypothetical protein